MLQEKSVSLFRFITLKNNKALGDISKTIGRIGYIRRPFYFDTRNEGGLDQSEIWRRFVGKSAGKIERIEALFETL